MAEYDKEKVKAILQDYEETLEVLTINSKPLINDLTMAAGRYKPLAPQIVAVIESRLFEVPVNQKLPLLYLLDSIMKNLRAKYLEIINTKVVAIFCHCFEKLTDPKIRISLYKLRQTWNPFVVKKKLAAIDKHVNALDPNWPVTATVTDPPSPTIHVNPDFLPVGGGKKVLPSAPSTSQSTPSASTTQSSSAKPTQTPSTKEVVGPPPTKTLEEKRKNVLEAQKRKKEELMAKGGATITQDSAGSSTTSLSSSLADPRKASAVSATVCKAEVTGSKRGKKRASRASRKPRKPLSSRSSLSPDYESKSSETKKKKLSRRPRSASPAPSHTPSSQSASQQDTQPGRGGLGEILKGLDISSLMGSIQRVKEQTEGETRSPAAPAAEDTNTQPKVDQPPPEKKPKLEDDVVDLASSTAPSKQEEVGGAKPVVLSKQEEVGGAKPAAPHKQEEVGGVKVAEEEEEEGLPAIKKSHLNLDDIPMELLPTHQERIMKQVESQLKSGRLSEEQHLTLVKQLDQLYALQRKKENGRERGDTSPPSPGPPRQRTPSPQPASGTISLPSSDNLRSCHNHLPTPHTITTHPPPPPPPAQQVVSDSEFHTHSPPSLPGPHLDRRHPHTHSPPRDRYRPRNHPKMGPRAPPRPQRGNRGRRPFNRQPRPPVTRPAIDWDGRGEEPMDHHQGGQEDHSGVAASTEYPPNQGNAGGGSNPTELFTRLVQFGLINEGEGPREGGVAPRQPTGPPPVQQQQQQQQQQVPERAPPLQFAIPKLSFTVATLKKPYSGLVQLMHMGEPCATCGLRFRDRSTADYSSHLDWHYKINSRDKAQQRPRNWFLHPEDWMKFEESTSGEDNREPLVLEREVEGMEEGGEGEGVASEEGERTSCEVLPGEEAEVCTICEEQFEQFWEEELEEWHFKEAIREGGKLYHTYCYQDAKESGALDRSLLLQQPTPTETEQKPLAVA